MEQLRSVKITIRVRLFLDQSSSSNTVLIEPRVSDTSICPDTVSSLDTVRAINEVISRELRLTNMEFNGRVLPLVYTR